MSTLAAKEETVRDWSHFLESISRFTVSLPPGVKYLFRGQGDKKWSLVPSLVRTRGIDVKLEPRDLLITEGIALLEFESQAHLYIPAAVFAEDDPIAEKWHVMQHYGAPTRLLDWTRSPYIAAYFSVESQHDKDGAVWVVDVPAIEEMLLKKYPDYWKRVEPESYEKHFLHFAAQPLVYFYGPAIQTDRMGAQQTAFSISTQVRADHAEIIGALCEEAGREICLTKLVIQAKDMKFDFLRKLREMNITARALFPGVDGLGRSVAEVVRLVHHQEGVAKLGFLGQGLVHQATGRGGSIGGPANDAEALYEAVAGEASQVEGSEHL